MIEFKNLSFHYPKSRRVLNNISLSFSEGNIYGLFGKNGEGKTSLLKIMSGLLFTKSGQYHINGIDGLRRNVSSLQHLFLVPEDFELSGVKIATYEKMNSTFYPNFSKSQFYDLIEEFHLSKNDTISTLSFGQKKKVLIAFGIATNTKVLLMDEPTNGLDIPSKSQFRKIMASITSEDKCIIISTHQVRDLHSLINHVVVLDNSKVVFNESLYKVSEHLCFGKYSTNSESIVYSESGFGGKSVYYRNDFEETEVDLELLFNAVLNNPNQITNALKLMHHE
ncbi:ABC transporter ATP-binding protein [Croceitalea rosinachiae]|uniref:ABC transporter ATP-binding protein n=1 Tax=Croceitalea rosinachiae TaxID=3075596 RepID=A0ABU3A7G0_9FLAO|nr:ABC transporter ATP-binding protein [Croceitalea sp. F388]MDT0605507.1 ABC transporter ATP-binding protein [Croceitalea sp. F388]